MSDAMLLKAIEARVDDGDYEYPLFNLLAILNRDGGHYRGEHGVVAAIAKAIDDYRALRARAEAAEAERDALRKIAEKALTAIVKADDHDYLPPGAVICPRCSTGDIARAALKRLRGEG